MKGTVVIILPDSVRVDYSTFLDFQLPKELTKYLDGALNVLVLPEGGSMHIGKAGVDVIGSLHKQIHEMEKK